MTWGMFRLPLLWFLLIGVAPLSCLAAQINGYKRLNYRLQLCEKVSLLCSLIPVLKIARKKALSAVWLLGKYLAAEAWSWAVPSIIPEPLQVVLQPSFSKWKPLISVASTFNKLQLLHENTSIIFTQRGDFPKRLSVCFSGKQAFVNLCGAIKKLVWSHIYCHKRRG